MTAPLLGGLLRMVHEAHLKRAYESATAVEFEDVTRAQFNLFRWPGADGLRPSEVAERTGLSKQSVNDLLGVLERNGYVERHPDPEDARARIIRLTSRGNRLLRTAYRTSMVVEAAWAESIGEERLEALRSTLVDMLDRGLPETS